MIKLIHVDKIDPTLVRIYADAKTDVPDNVDDLAEALTPNGYTSYAEGIGAGSTIIDADGNKAFVLGDGSINWIGEE